MPLELMMRLGLIFLMMIGPLFGQSNGDLSPAEAQALIQEWVKAERLASGEMREWEAKRDSMSDLLTLYEKEMGLLSEEVERVGEALQNEDTERVQLKEEVEVMRKERLTLAKVVVENSARMLRLAKRFPEPLRETVRESLANLEAVKGEREIRSGVLALVTILKEASRFNRIVTVKKQMEVSADGKQRQMEVIYLGLGRGYYLSGDVGGVGVPSEGGWVWTERGGVAPRVREALDIFNGVVQPKLVELPVGVAE